MPSRATSCNGNVVPGSIGEGGSSSHSVAPLSIKDPKSIVRIVVTGDSKEKRITGIGPTERHDCSIASCGNGCSWIDQAENVPEVECQSSSQRLRNIEEALNSAQFLLVLLAR